MNTVKLSTLAIVLLLLTACQPGEMNTTSDNQDSGSGASIEKVNEGGEYVGCQGKGKHEGCGKNLGNCQNGDCINKENCDEDCPHKKSQELLIEKVEWSTISLQEAFVIASEAEICKGEEKANQVFEKGYYNPNSKTWWLETDLAKEGCNPMCVVHEVTKEAEINWMCTGLK